MQQNSVRSALIVTAIVTFGGIALGSVLQRTVNDEQPPGIARQGESADSVNPGSSKNNLQDKSLDNPARQQTEQSDPANDNSSLEDGENSAETLPAASEGTYEPYEEQTVAASRAETKIIYFNAVDCAVCREFETAVLQEGVPKNVAIYHIDIEAEAELTQRYEVEEAGTLILLDDEGEERRSYHLRSGSSLKRVLSTLR